MENKMLRIENAVIIEILEDVEIVIRDKRTKDKILDRIKRKFRRVRNKTHNLETRNFEYKSIVLSEIHDRITFK